MSYVGAILVVIVFSLLLHYFDLVKHCSKVIAQSRSAVALLKDQGLDDEAKEKALQASSVSMLGLFLKIVALSGLCIFLPIALLWLLDFVNVMSIDAVLEVLQTWEFLLIAAVIGAMAYYGLERLSQQ